MKTQIDIYEERLEIYNRDNGICQFCEKPVSINEFQVSHRIANAKWARKKYGAEVIDHPLNKACTHSGRCNDGVLVTYNPCAAESLARSIRETIHRECQQA